MVKRGGNIMKAGFKFLQMGIILIVWIFSYLNPFLPEEVGIMKAEATENSGIPVLDRSIPEQLETATFALG